TEGRQKVIKRNLVGYVDRGHTKAPLVLLAAKNVVISYCDVEQVARCDTRRVVIIVLSSRRRNRYSRGAVLRWRASSQRRAQRGKHIPTEQPGLQLLVGGQPGQIDGRGCIRGKWNRTCNQSAVITPSESDPRSCLPGLILHMCRLVKFLVVVNPKNSAGG